MNYINYFSQLPIDSIILNDEKYHRIRVLFRSYKLLGRYLNSAIMQYNRIEEWANTQKKLGSRNVEGMDVIENELLISDIHFLLLAMDKCNKIQTSLYRSLFGNDEANIFYNSPHVCNVRKMRNTLEHMDEYIKDDSRNKKYKLDKIFIDNGWSWLETQLLTLSKGKFSIKDCTLDFSVEMFNDSIAGLNNIATELMKQINQLK